MARETASKTGAAFGVVAAILFAAVIFTGYSLLSENTRTMLGFTPTQQTPVQNPAPVQVTPQSEQRPPVTETDKVKDQESSSQNAN